MAPSPSSPPFVGRERERAELDRLLSRAVAEGIGAAVRVVGEAGIGKSRLVEEVVLGEHPTGVPTTWAAIDEAEQGRPFAALARALELPDLLRSSVDPTSVVSGDGLWLGVDVVVDAVERQARNGPAVLVIDDLQWADRGTWLAVASLARRAPVLGLVVVGIHRPLSSTDSLPVPATAAGPELLVPPLLPEEAVALAGSVLGADGASAITAAEVARAGGNAFFTIELATWLRARVEADEPPSTAGRATALGRGDEQLRAALLGRIDTFDATTTAVLRSASILGRRTSVADLCRSTGFSPAQVAAAVEEAARSGVLIDGSDGIAFRHDLLRAAVRAEVPSAFVAAHDAHLLAGAVVDPWAAEQLARRAAPGDVGASVAVLRAARSPGVAPETVARLLEHVRRLGPPPEVSDAEVALEVVVALACAGDLSAAAARGAEMIASLSPTAAAEHPTQEAALRRMVARLDLARGFIDDALAGLRPVAEGTGPISERAASDVLLLEVMSLRRPDAVSDAEELRTHTDDAVARCSAELAVAVHAMRTGDADAAVDAASAAVAQTALEPGLTAELHPEVFLANALFAAERFDEAAEAVERAAAAAARAGILWPVPHHLAHRAGEALRIGDLEGCRTAAREAAEWSVDTDQRLGGTWAHVFAAVVGAFTGELDDARVALERGETDLAAGRWQGTEAVPWAAALVVEAEGDPGGGAARLAPVVELAAALGWRSKLPLLAPEVARMAWLARDQECLDRLDPVIAAMAQLPTHEAAAAVERCTGFRDGEVAGLLAAATNYEELGSATQAATAWAEAGLVAARSGDHDRAVALLRDEAFPRLAAIGADGIEARTRAALPVRVTRRLGSARPRPVDGPGSLTPAERTVVELVMTGATNGEIAAQLTVSRRTVESHLARIYRKLGVDRRSRLIAADPLAG